MCTLVLLFGGPLVRSRVIVRMLPVQGRTFSGYGVTLGINILRIRCISIKEGDKARKQVTLDRCGNLFPDNYYPM